MNLTSEDVEFISTFKGKKTRLTTVFLPLIRWAVVRLLPMVLIGRRVYMSE